MIVLVLVAILWIAVLIPTILSKWSERRSSGSIGRFHQRLDLLERTGPKLVEPAYRLTGSDSARTSVLPLIVPVSPPPIRPSLRLVAPGDQASGDGDEPQASLMERDDPMTLEEFTQKPAPSAAEQMARQHWEARATVGNKRERRRLIRKRRRDVFALLCALAAITGLLGLAHPLRGAWVVSGIFVGLLVMFVALAVYGQHVEAEQRHLSRLDRAHRAKSQDPDLPGTITYRSDEEIARYHGTRGHDEAEGEQLVAQG